MSYQESFPATLTDLCRRVERGERCVHMNFPDEGGGQCEARATGVLTYSLQPVRCGTYCEKHAQWYLNDPDENDGGRLRFVRVEGVEA